MAISRAFTKNTGSPIFGTAQTGNIAYTLPGTTINFAATGLTWYNGPEEGPAITEPSPGGTAGYIICAEGTTSIPGSENNAPIKFYRSNGFNEAAFIKLAENVLGSTFNTGNLAEAALTSAGYFCDWEQTVPNITYQTFSWYRYLNLGSSFTCPTMPEGSNLYLGSDNLVYYSVNGSLFNTELDEGLVDQDGLFSSFTGAPTGRVYTVSYGVLTQTTRQCAII